MQNEDQHHEMPGTQIDRKTANQRPPEHSNAGCVPEKMAAGSTS
jgi:hypothetical protein